MSQNEPLGVTAEFIQQSLEHSKEKRRNKKGGPYSKHDREKRREEVYRLNIEYGYTARKIANLMKINRNTINSDIDYLYSNVFKNINTYNPENFVILNIERMEIQLTRLREQLDKTNNESERIKIERQIFDIISKIANTWLKLSESSYRAHKQSVDDMNEYMKQNKNSQRFIRFFDKISVSDKAEKAIDKIITQDKMHPKLSRKF